MKQYAVTVVFYLNSENENEAKMVTSQMIDDTYLSNYNGESVDIVEVSEVKF